MSNTTTAFLLIVMTAIFAIDNTNTNSFVHAWVVSSTTPSTTMTLKTTLSMDVEAPPTSYTQLPTIPSSSGFTVSRRWNEMMIQQNDNNRRSRRRSPSSSPFVILPEQEQEQEQQVQDKSSSPSLLDECHLPWSSISSSSSSSDDRFVYQSQWDWQMQYFTDNLTNLRVKEQQSEEEEQVDDLLHMISKDGSDRIYTVSLESNEYRDIRMTYLDCDNGATQIFRCACYPRSNAAAVNGGDEHEEDPIPVLGLGFMSFANGRRNVAIMDYQPLNSNAATDGVVRPTDNLYQSQLRSIRSQFGDFQQSMSDKHFDADEKQLYWTETPLIAKWNVASDDDTKSTETNDTWDQLISSHQRVVDMHVQMTKTLVGDSSATSDDSDLMKLHTEYDTFLSAREPAGHLLSKAFGPDIADRMVHKVLFPLSSSS